MSDSLCASDSIAIGIERSQKRAFNSIAIIGAGVVGMAMRSALGVDVKMHDPPLGVISDLNVDVAFICVPTPCLDDGTVDVSMVIDAISQLNTGTVAVIRSTILPGTTEMLQEEYPNIYLMHVPEFLTEETAEHDERHPHRKIIGYTSSSKRFAKDVAELLPDSKFVAYVTSREAEAIKYFANAFYALKVAYANQFFDMCERLGVYYAMVRECALADPMMAPNHTTIMHNGYRGFGGKCLPKDTKAIVALGRAAGVPQTLLEEALRYNDSLASDGQL